MKMGEIDKYGWKYIVKGKKFEVVPKKDEAKPKPNTLFKYYGLNELSIDALSKSYIYSPHPDQFNDPFDCYDNLIEFDDADILFNFLSPDYTREEIEEKIRNPDLKFMRTVQFNFKLVMYSKLGLISFNDDPENILMWSYYSNHEGFCLEFDYHKFPFKFQGPFQINYQELLEPISVKHLHLSLLYQTNIKKAAWQHESEWRILTEKSIVKQMKMPGIDSLKHHFGTDRKFEYHIDCLKSITIGNNFFNNHNEIKVRDNQLHIFLQERVELKKLLLGYALTEKIPFCIIRRDNDKYELRRNLIQIEQLGETHFRIL